jgi:hypothetical protein
MATNLIKNKFFRSKDIKIFPSSFRGTYRSGDAESDPEITFDPEARLNTEANFILPGTTLGKESYIISYDSQGTGKLKFVLGGYYFELLEVQDYIDELLNKYVGIKFRSVSLQEPNLDAAYQRDSSRSTLILDSWESTSDLILDVEDPDGYYFTGLQVLDTSTPSNAVAASLKLFTEDGEINQKDLLPNIEHGQGTNTLTHGLGLIAEGSNQTIVGTYNKNNPDSLFEVGCGDGPVETSRKNALEVTAEQTAINTATTITGNTDVIGSLSVSEKITSALTEADDDDNVLITKSYVDNKISNIGTGTPTGGEGQYVVSVSQSNGAVETDLKDFATEVTNDATNAPTSQAVTNFVTSKISALKTEGSVDGWIGGSNTYIQKIKETNGIIEATPKSFSTSISKDSDDSTAPSAKAVYQYIKRLLGGELDPDDTTISDTIGSTIQDKVDDIKLEAAAGGTGSYIKAIEQSSGVITPTAQAFDTGITANTENAPTSAAVKSYVDGKITGAWLTNIGLPSDPKNAGEALPGSLKKLILEATYPVGSIYIQYVANSSNVPDNCPIAATLGGSWNLIDSGRFLRSVGDEGATRGNTGGSADAVVVNHTHDSEIVAATTGISVSNLSKSGWFRIRTMQSNDSKTIPEVDGTVVKNEDLHGDGRASIDYHGNSGPQQIKVVLDHGHSVTDEGHTHTINMTNPTDTSGKNIGATATNANLPPYLNVYMWRRTS